jgi:outer membrane murein-binding lipoprotein Lpp
MLSIKNTLIAGAVAFAVGYIAGYATRDDQAEIERLNGAKYALEQERANLIQQLEVEHEHQKTAQINAAKTQEDLDDLEKRYASAIDELNALQLQFSEYTDSDTAALSKDASASSAVSQGKCGCSGKDKRAFQKLLNDQMIVAKDCDINATYLNRLIDWYSQL